MLIRPELQALRSNDAPQRDAQRAMSRIHQHWREAHCGAIEPQLARLAAGEALDQLPALAALFDPASDALQRLLGPVLQPVLAQMAAEPISLSPLRSSVSEVQAAIVLARSGTTALILQHFDGAALARKPRPASTSFLATETWERVLAGSGTALRVRMLGEGHGRAELECCQIDLTPGQVLHRLGRSESVILTAVPGSLVQLKLQRRIDCIEPVREYRLVDGALLHQSAANLRDSRLEMTATLLGRMKRRDAAPLLAAMAEERGAASLRWQALRECLGLDTAIGFRTLCGIAEREGDPLQAPAAALRLRLTKMHPELNGLAPCPA